MRFRTKALLTLAHRGKVATATPIKLCPECDGTGEEGRTLRFLNGAIIPRLPDVGDHPECARCHGGGLIYVAEFRQHP